MEWPRRSKTPTPRHLLRPHLRFFLDNVPKGLRRRHHRPPPLLPTHPLAHSASGSRFCLRRLRHNRLASVWPCVCLSRKPPLIAARSALLFLHGHLHVRSCYDGWGGYGRRCTRPSRSRHGGSCNRRRLPLAASLVRREGAWPLAAKGAPFVGVSAWTPDRSFHVLGYVELDPAPICRLC